MRNLPIVECRAEVLGEKGEWFRKWVSNRDVTTEHWPKMRLGDALDRVNVPVLIHTGWQDIFLQQAMWSSISICANEEPTWP